MNLRTLRIPVGRWAGWALVGLFVCDSPAFAQRLTSSGAVKAWAESLTAVNGSTGSLESQLARIDYTQMVLDQQNGGGKKKDRAGQQQLIDSGTVSALDLAAPAKAVSEFNTASSLLRAQRPQEAVGHLQKAIARYPQFVSAHNGLGVAYLDLEDTPRAQSELETAARLDDKFPGSFLNLGRLALSQDNFTAAGSYLEKAAALRPTDTAILTALAYAQNGNHQYRAAIQTVGRVHELQHKGMGNVHYVAAAAAAALDDFQVARRELTLFLQEDPANPLAPTARINLDILIANERETGQPLNGPSPPAGTLALNQPQGSPNSARLKAQLAAAGNEAGGETCHDCTEAGKASAAASFAALYVAADPPEQWTIRKTVDEVALFFGVTSGGHSIRNLDAHDITIRDDDKPPEKVLQFTPQSNLPLRLGLLIDTSGSVEARFLFEKQAAAKFLLQVLTDGSDLGFVIGFANTPTVTQDFTGDKDKLADGIAKLDNKGGTALFDAVSFACWKLAAYPDPERVAKVLIVVTDGDDNSSHSSLRQAIRDSEAAGVTIYTISTRAGAGPRTEADKVLDTLAERSGGEALFPGSMATLARSFDRLQDQIRSRYLIAYKPADLEPNGRYRTISIIAEQGDKHLQVHARKGYHARMEANVP